MDHKAEHPATDEVVSNGYSNEPIAPKKGGRIKNHCRRFWWCDLLVVIVIVLVIVLPIVFVAIPKKAQHDLDASTLNVTAQNVTSPAPDGLHLKLVSVAKSSSKFHPTIEGFRAGLSLEGKDPFIYVDVPETKAESETDIVIEQDVKFASLDRFIDYNKVVMGSEEFVISMSGKTKVHQSGLRAISVDYNKKVTMKGLNKLSGLNITTFKILSGTNEILEDGSNMVGTVLIPNPSVMLLDLGNVTMNLSVNGTAIGTALLPGLVLKPGDNLVPMQSTVDQLGVLTLIQNKYKNAVLPIDIVGNSSVVGGQHLKYYEAAIQSNSVRLDLNLGPALLAIGINVSSIIS